MMTPIVREEVERIERRIARGLRRIQRAIARGDHQTVDREESVLVGCRAYAAALRAGRRIGERPSLLETLAHAS